MHALSIVVVGDARYMLHMFKGRHGWYPHILVKYTSYAKHNQPKRTLLLGGECANEQATCWQRMARFMAGRGVQVGDMPQAHSMFYRPSAYL